MASMQKPPYPVPERAARIPLWARDGNVKAYALVDAEDADRVGRIHWYANAVNRGDDKLRAVCWRNGHNVMMHRFILGLSRNDPEVDHINGDPLDNRRLNLRLVTRLQNKQNLDPRGQSNSTSGVRGVSWDGQTGKWRATIQIAGVQYRLGRFLAKEDAASAVVAFRRKHMPFSARDQAEGDS